MIFISEKLHISDNLADTLNDLIINDADYYVSYSETANNAKGDSSSNPKTGTHTKYRKGKVTDASNVNFKNIY